MNRRELRASGMRPGPAGPGNGEEDDDPGLVVAGAEVADVGGLEEAGLGAGVALGVAGGGVLAGVLDVVVEA